MPEELRTATPITLPSFDEYIQKTDVLSRIEQIHRFKFTVTYQQTGAIETKAAKDAILSEGYAVINDLLETTRLHSLHHLSARASRSIDNPAVNNADSSDPLIEFVFGHDTHHCRFQFFQDRFSIERQSSSFKEFYDWYGQVMPAALRIEMTLRQIIQTATGKSLRPVQSAYDFVFDFCQFRKPRNAPNQEEYRNMDVLARIIPQFPDGKEMRSLPGQQFYRLDLAVSKQEDFGGLSRNVWYYVEAPFNRNGRFIVFTAQLRNSSTEILEEGKVVGTRPFDADFGSDYSLALLDFLRDSALEGFASELLKDWDFSTERNI
jgi:hypothetical protein